MKKKSLKKSSKKEKKRIIDFGIRYGLLIFFSLLTVYFFKNPGYFFDSLLGPATTYLSYFFIDLFYDAILQGNFILINGEYLIEIAGPCIAGSAYFLLLFLNFSTPNILLRKRIYSLVLSFGIIFVLNILRIFLLSNLYVMDFVYFDFLHKLFWYFISTIIVVLTWFFQVMIFRIQDVPAYTDLKYLYKIASSK